MLSDIYFVVKDIQPLPILSCLLCLFVIFFFYYHFYLFLFLLSSSNTSLFPCIVYQYCYLLFIVIIILFCFFVTFFFYYYFYFSYLCCLHLTPHCFPFLFPLTIPPLFLMAALFCFDNHPHYLIFMSSKLHGLLASLFTSKP